MKCIKLESYKMFLVMGGFIILSNPIPIPNSPRVDCKALTKSQ